MEESKNSKPLWSSVFAEWCPSNGILWAIVDSRKFKGMFTVVTDRLHLHEQWKDSRRWKARLLCIQSSTNSIICSKWSSILPGKYQRQISCIEPACAVYNVHFFISHQLLLSSRNKSEEGKRASPFGPSVYVMLGRGKHGGIGLECSRQGKARRSLESSIG